MKRLITFLKRTNYADCLKRSLMMVMFFSCVSMAWSTGYLYMWKDGGETLGRLELTFNDKVGTTTFSMTKNQKFGIRFIDVDDSQETTWYGPDNNNQTILLNNSYPYSSNENNGFFTAPEDGIYKLTITWGNNPSLKIEKVNNIGEYYLVVPKENVGNTLRAVNATWVPANHKAFKLDAGRERNQKTLNADITSLTLKIDGDNGRQLRYDKNSLIRFYIYDAKNNQYFQPGTSDDPYLKQTYKTSNDRDGVTAINGNFASNNNKYFILHKNDAKATVDGKDYQTMSLTFMFSKNNYPKQYNEKWDDKPDDPWHPMEKGNSIYYMKDGNRTLGGANLIISFLKTRAYDPYTHNISKYYNEHINGKQVYIVGNIATDKYLNGSESDYQNNKAKYEMLPDFWKEGRIRTDISAEEADSIVYSCEIKKGSASWDNFFLSFTTSDVLGNTGTMWNPLLRPRLQNQMDAQALEGGIFYYLTGNADGASNQQQSLNPLLTNEQKERYGSYRVYFNATYSTYRIAFSDKFCIGGPAVNNVENSNVSDDAMFGADYRHGLDYVPAANGMPEHYIYENQKFCQGSTFAFFGDANHSLDNYAEDDDAVGGEILGEWNTQAPKAGTDYAFYNRVDWSNNGGTNGQSLGTGRKGILWTLPTGYYTLRFFNHVSNTETGTANDHAFYTIDKKVELVNATSTYPNEDGVDYTENRGGLRTFSDDCALVLPAGVQAYYVREIKDGNAVLREVENNIIPAHCPVLIYDRTQLEGRKTIRLTPSPIGHTDSYSGYTKKLADTETNLLVDCYDADKTIKAFENGKYNFYMTNKYYFSGLEGNSTSVPLNFWKVLNNSTAKKNYTYLSVEENIRPLAYTGAKNYEYENDPGNIASNARRYCFLLSIGNIDDDNVTTGITSIDSDKNNANDNNVWYTIQGVRVSSPIMPGIYIHNGKKVMVK